MLHIPLGMNKPGRQFGRQVDFLSVSIAQRFAHQGFALLAVVTPRGVDVIDALIDGGPNHVDGLRLINFSVVITQRGQAHAAKTEG